MKKDPYEVYRLHKYFLKICHLLTLLTVIDEYGQIIVIDLLSRYCRKFFQKPVALAEGMAERIDKQRRVQRPILQIINNTIH